MISRAKLVATVLAGKSKSLDKLESAKLALQKCILKCQEALDYFKKEGNQFPDKALEGMFRKCLKSCKTALKELEKGENYNTNKIENAADDCKLCADLCEQFPDEPILRDCTQSCRTCDATLREFLSTL